LIRWNNK